MDVDYVRVWAFREAGDGLYVSVSYDEGRWRILREKRAQALKMMEALLGAGIDSITYGSVARGDVHPLSDVEVFVPRPVNTVVVEAIVERAHGGWVRREVVQATPGYVPKGYIYLDEYSTVSFPLVEMLRSESIFYDIAGKLDLKGVKGGERVPGMNKEMKVIIPTEYGHAEFPAEKDPEHAAKLLRIDPQALRRRIEVLRRRRLHGKTGVFVKVVLGDSESFSNVLERLIDENPWLRRRVRG
ncbi:MAG: hypothetical protein RMJ28_01580 [Nitrososphaerota archaeon]|nr:hypothetical protein [Candidatus Calditenuaceae archaeon]MDW8072915.1 hypothetical protein [Nitrososphaerota archaeon]